MPRFPINSSQITDNKAIITGESFKHISKVLRLTIDDQLTLFDELYNEHTGKIVSVDRNELEVLILKTNKNIRESNIKIHLFQSIPKGSKMALIVQKTTELGVTSITPIRTQRGIVQDSRKSERWKKIAIESCKQCGRPKPTEINDFIDFRNINEFLSTDHLSLLFYENEVNNLHNYLNNQNPNYNTINIIIGPEGGFTDSEIEYAKKNSISIVGLGPRILRVETASIAAVTAIQYQFGDL